VDGTGSGSQPSALLGMSAIECSNSATTDLFRLSLSSSKINPLKTKRICFI
jgi:hypothetical protein